MTCANQWFKGILFCGGALALMASAACSGPDDFNGFIAASANYLTTRVDVAVGDQDATATAPVNSKVLLYFDVVQSAEVGANLLPDVTLNEAKSKIIHPASVVLSGNDLYVANLADVGTTENVVIFRNYLGLSNNAAPSVQLKPGAPATIHGPVSISVSQNANTMAVANNTDNNVLLFGSIKTLAANVAPTAILNNANSLINDPRGLTIIDDENTSNPSDLYVANHANASGALASVTIYRDVATIATNDVPDTRLNADTSFMATGCAPNNVDVINNTLYVSTDSSACGIFIFNNASTLATDALPDVVLTGLSGFYFSARNVAIANNGLFVADAGDATSCSNNPGLFGFFPADGLTSSQAPDLSFSQIQGAAAVRSAAGDALIVAELNNCNDPYGKLDVFLPVSTLQSDGSPFVAIDLGSNTPDVGLLKPISLAVRERDLGT